jgi:hypothetical protein
MTQIMRGRRPAVGRQAPDAALPGRTVGAFQLDPVIFGKGLPDDPLEVADPPGRARPLPIGQVNLPAAQDFPPEPVDGTPPARVEEIGRGPEDVRHALIFHLPRKGRT